MTKPAKRKAEPNRKMFTESNVRTLPFKKKQYLVWDGGNGRGSRDVVRGLCVLISPKGARSYRSYYYFPGSPTAHSRTLGRVGVLSLAEARDQCREDQKLARGGIDPRGDDERQSNAAFAAAVAEYTQREQIARKKNVSAKEAERMLLNAFQSWHHRPVSTITADEIVKALELVRDGDAAKDLKPRPYLANSLHARLNVFFKWCCKPGVNKIKVTPMIGIDKPWDGEQARDRAWFKGTVADKFIKTLWACADEIGGTEGSYLKVLLLTGKRPGAIANMRWNEIDDDWFWHAPQSNKKNKRLHAILLPDLVQRILHPRKASGFVFPGDDHGHINVRGKLQRRIVALSGTDDFIFHGLRHLAETKTAEIEIAPHIRDMLFDHAVRRGSGKDYDHHHYKREMLEALNKWGAHVEALVTAEGVRRLR